MVRERHGVLDHPLSRMMTSGLGAYPFDHMSTTHGVTARDALASFEFAI
jgi:hypothetical protein